MYTQKLICVHIWTKNMGRFYHNFDGFLMVYVQKLCIEPLLISLNPILTEFVMMLVSPPNRHPLMICHQLTQSEWEPDHIQFLSSTITKSVFILANSTDPDETLHFAASHLGLRYLYMFLFRMHSACSTSADFEFETSYCPASQEWQWRHGFFTTLLGTYNW